MAIEGSLEVFQLPEILQMISAQRKTGILTVQGESDIVAVSFKDGQVVAADALNQTVEDGLGQILASQGLVSPRDFAAAASEHDGGSKRLLDLLLERGFVQRGQLLEALRLQTYRLLLQLLRWDQGEFKFYSGEEVAYEEGFHPISIEELLIRSLSELGDDAEPGGQPDLDVIYERVPGAPVRYLGIDGSEPDATGVWVAGEDRPLVDALDGNLPLGVLADQTGVGHYRALFSLYKLLRAGAVRPVAGKAAAAQRSPAPAGGPRRTPSVAPEPTPPAKAPAPAPRASVLPAVAVEEPDELPEIPAVVPIPAQRIRQVALPRPEVQGPSPLAVWATRLVALAMGVFVAATPWLAPRPLLLPYPWQETSRTVLERNQRSALYLQIDRAARTYFLLDGHYPDSLQELVGRELLSPASLHDPAGHRLAYTAGDLSYEVEPVVGAEPQTELGVHEGISGDFLLDPDFLELPERPERPPLVLLD